MAIGDVYQLSVNQTLYGVSLANVYTFEQLTDISAASSPEASLMEAWQEIMMPLQRAMSSVDWGQVCLTARKVRPTGGVRFVSSVTAVGDLLEDAFSANTCCLGSLYSNNVGPRGRGRHWYAGLGKSRSDKGRLTAAGFADFGAFLARLITVVKWTADNAQFIIRIISTVDAIIRAVSKAECNPALHKLDNRTQKIC